MRIPTMLLNAKRLFVSVMEDTIPAGEQPIPADLGCKNPPADWYCSREPGHEGPCAARPRMWLGMHSSVARSDLKPAPAPRRLTLHEELRDAAVTLREAQKGYMADRGNPALGALVAQCADNLDAVIERWDERYGNRRG